VLIDIVRAQGQKSQARVAAPAPLHQLEAARRYAGEVQAVLDAELARTLPELP
jgi:hypothetical protein